MSTQTMEITADNVLRLIEQMPAPEKLKLRALLEHQAAPAQPVAKAPRDKRVPSEPMPDRMREWEWIKQHKDEYAGQWVALEGDRLLAASLVQQEVWDALKTVDAKRPIVHRISAPEDLPYIGI